MGMDFSHTGGSSSYPRFNEMMESLAKDLGIKYRGITDDYKGEMERSKSFDSMYGTTQEYIWNYKDKLTWRFEYPEYTPDSIIHFFEDPYGEVLKFNNTETGEILGYIEAKLPPEVCYYIRWEYEVTEKERNILNKYNYTQILDELTCCIKCDEAWDINR